MASVFLGTVLMCDMICVCGCVNTGEDTACVWAYAWRESGQRINEVSSKKQICRPPGIYVTDEKQYEKEENFRSAGRMPVNTRRQRKERTRSKL